MEFAVSFMRLIVACALAVAILSSVRAEKSSPSLHASFDRYVATMKAINSSPYLRDEWRKHMNLFREDPVVAQIRRTKTYASLTCESYQAKSAEVPRSVHRLRVGDIKVVAAMGDSLTAANGARAWTVIGCLTNYRGTSWSIGGDGSFRDGQTQLPNIMKQFNPDLIGFSVGNGDEDSSGANLNVAVAGSIAQDMPGQAVNLVDKIRADRNIDFNNDWKMVTLFIGGNNLCDYCTDLNSHSASTYVSEIQRALDYLHENLPRTYVNLVEVFDITPVAGLGTGLICGMVHNAVCGCGHNIGDAQKAELSALSRDYQRVVSQLVDSGRYDRKDDFVVVNQPFLRETAPPLKSNGSPDLTYFAPDCFHFSTKGQNIAGKALWNNLVSPIGRKHIEWGENEPVQCPQTTYLPTKFN